MNPSILFSTSHNWPTTFVDPVQTKIHGGIPSRQAQFWAKQRYANPLPLSTTLTLPCDVTTTGEEQKGTRAINGWTTPGAIKAMQRHAQDLPLID